MKLHHSPGESTRDILNIVTDFCFIVVYKIQLYTFKKESRFEKNVIIMYGKKTPIVYDQRP